MISSKKIMTFFCTLSFAFSSLLAMQEEFDNLRQLAALGAGYKNTALLLTPPCARCLARLKDDGGNFAHYIAENFKEDMHNPVVFDGWLRLIQELKTCDFDLNEPNAEGQTPLAVAILNNNVNAVRLLVAAGANAGIPYKFEIVRIPESELVPGLEPKLERNVSLHEFASSIKEINPEIVVILKNAYPAWKSIFDRLNVSRAALVVAAGRQFGRDAAIIYASPAWLLTVIGSVVVPILGSTDKGYPLVSGFNFACVGISVGASVWYLLSSVV